MNRGSLTTLPVPSPSRLGYRQKAILDAFQGHGELPVGFLIRSTGADGKTVHVALVGLRERGLVCRVRHGVWERVAA